MKHGETVYVSGPMRNKRQFNFPLFFEIEYECVLRGARQVFNPARHDLDLYPDLRGWAGYESGETGDEFNLCAAMAWDLGVIATDCTAIVMLPDWKHSTGARIERAAAEACGLNVYLAHVCDEGYSIALDPIQKRMVTTVAVFA